MLQIYSVAVIFRLSCGKTTSKKTKCLEKDEIKKQLLDSMATNNAVEIEELNDRAEKVEKPEDAAEVIRDTKKLYVRKKTSSWLCITNEKFLNVLRKRKSFKKW